MKILSLRLLIAFVMCIGFGVLFGYIAAAINNETIESFDMSIIGFVQGLETPWLTAVMKTFTWIGSAVVVIAITLISFTLLFFFLHYRQQAFLLLTVVLGSVLFNYLLKIYFKRERPEIHRILDIGGFSFPSGHTMMAFSLYTILSYIAWRNAKTTPNRILLTLFVAFMILMIGLSRIYLGVHYPSDVVGGIAASGFWGTIAVVVYAFYQNQKKWKSPSYKRF